MAIGDTAGYAIGFFVIGCVIAMAVMLYLTRNLDLDLAEELMSEWTGCIIWVNFVIVFLLITGGLVWSFVSKLVLDRLF